MDVVKKQDYEKAANLRDKERRILHELENEKGKFEVSLETNKKIVPVDLVYEVVSNMTKIPISKLNSDETRQLTGLENTLNKKVIGQSEAVKKISKSIRRNRLGIKDPNKPIGSFIFLGSTGVGKTHLAKELAKEMFGSVDSMIRVDMSEYQEKHTISRLIGSPPGYVGHDEGGQLTEQVKNKPYSVILFDEIEKANKDIFATLLQVLDDGHLTDGLGRKINFKNCVIIMTSNIGVKKLQDFGSGIGFQTGDNNYIEEERRADTLKKELKKFFAPEFLNRIDDVIIFNSLGKDEVKHIIQLEMDKLSVRLSEMKYYIEFDKTIIQMLSEIGYDTTYGARPIKRAIQDKLEDFISEEVLVGNITVEEKYTLISKDGEVKIKPKRGRVTKKGGK
jgi:ATP-dependent Clp protease ATP-binding subunit ClpC